MSAKLIAGLGNVGARYEGTRHNLGFLVVDSIAQELGIGWNSAAKLKSMVATGRHGSCRVVLLKPLTYMNLSGNAVTPAMKFYDIALEDLLVVVDDVSLPLGRTRFRAGGSSGGHNGLRDIERALGTQAFNRLRIGVGPEPVRKTDSEDEDRNDARRTGDMTRFVLGRFTRDEEEEVASQMTRFMDAGLCWVEGGITAAMSRFNTKPMQADEEGNEQ